MSEGQNLPKRCINYLSGKYTELEKYATSKYDQHLRKHEQLPKQSINYLSEKYTELEKYAASKYDQHLKKHEKHLPEQVIENKGLIAKGLIVIGGAIGIYKIFTKPAAGPKDIIPTPPPPPPPTAVPSSSTKGVVLGSRKEQDTDHQKSTQIDKLKDNKVGGSVDKGSARSKKSREEWSFDDNGEGRDSWELFTTGASVTQSWSSTISSTTFLLGGRVVTSTPSLSASTAPQKYTSSALTRVASPSILILNYEAPITPLYSVSQSSVVSAPSLRDSNAPFQDLGLYNPHTRAYMAPSDVVASIPDSLNISPRVYKLEDEDLESEEDLLALHSMSQYGGSVSVLFASHSMSVLNHEDSLMPLYSVGQQSSVVSTPSLGGSNALQGLLYNTHTRSYMVAPSDVVASISPDGLYISSPVYQSEDEGLGSEEDLPPLCDYDEDHDDDSSRSEPPTSSFSNELVIESIVGQETTLPDLRLPEIPQETAHPDKNKMTELTGQFFDV